jgi:hypothetical protein
MGQNQHHPQQQAAAAAALSLGHTALLIMFCYGAVWAWLGSGIAWHSLLAPRCTVTRNIPHKSAKVLQLCCLCVPALPPGGVALANSASMRKRGGVLQVDTFTPKRYSSLQITWYKPKPQRHVCVLLQAWCSGRSLSCTLTLLCLEWPTPSVDKSSLTQQQTTGQSHGHTLHEFWRRGWGLRGTHVAQIAAQPSTR